MTFYRLNHLLFATIYLIKEVRNGCFCSFLPVCVSLFDCVIMHLSHGKCHGTIRKRHYTQTSMVWSTLIIS